MTPYLILVSGPPGAGKSTLAKPLAANLSAVLLDKDCIDEPFSPNDRGSRYTHEIEPKVLQGLLNLAAINLNNGLSVILDVPWTHILINSPEWITRIQSLAESTKSRLVVFECVIDEHQLKERLTLRGLTRDKAKLTDDGWSRFHKNDCLGYKNPLPHIAIDITQTPERCLEDALQSLSQEVST